MAFMNLLFIHLNYMYTTTTLKHTICLQYNNNEKPNKNYTQGSRREDASRLEPPFYPQPISYPAASRASAAAVAVSKH